MKYILVLFLFVTNTSFGQSYQSQRNQVFVYNILTNGLISGVGGAINKKKSEKLWPVFFKSFGKGALGGAIKYTAKLQTYYFNDKRNVFFAPVNRAYFFLGHSIAMNGSMNQGVLENYYCNFYGMNLKYLSKEEKGDRFQARLSLGTLGSAIYFTALGLKLDPYKSFEYGQLYFNMDDDFVYNGISVHGLAGFNLFAIRTLPNGLPAQASVPHEIVHTYQAYEFFGISNFYKKKLDPILERSKIYNFTSRFVDYDYEGAFFSALYVVQPKPRYYKNFFEFEAEHFDRRGYIER